MTEDNFVDYVKVFVRSGNGGAGSSHLRREKFVAKGGPDGGDGGNGGNIIFKTDKNLWTLFHFKFKKHFKAEHGKNGGKSRSSGANGNDEYIKIPIGSVIKDTDSGEVLFESIEHGEEFNAVPGGKGGLGNWHFKSSTNQTPKYSQPGVEGTEKKLTIELKVLADVGFVGFPNSGKSTLLSVLTDAKPKIGDYEFTTLKPNLGIVKYKDYNTFVISDIPGIIKGASKGKGLGHHFLRHIERNSILVFLVSCESKNIDRKFNILLDELKKYDSQLLDKEKILAVTKCDLIDKEKIDDIKSNYKLDFMNIDVHFISSVTQMGLKTLKDSMWKKLNISL
tara:strand:- start:389 stop:1396 length:1008 start_codon:yes stop_codon:yes gene_type:complete